MSSIRVGRPRVALVGSGAMGALHARVLAQSPRCEFVRLVECREDVGRRVADDHGVQWAPDFDHLAGIDAVVVAAATDAHYDIAARVLELGKPVLVEKPLAASYRQSLRLVQMSERRGLPLLCGLLERFNPAVRTALRFVGDVVQVHAVRHSPFVPRVSTGVAGDLLIHDVDLALRFLGEQPADVKGSFGYFHPTSRENRAEDSADATMSFPSGAMATVSASRVSQRKVRHLSLLEIGRLIEIDLLRRDVTIYKHVANSTMDDGVGYQQQTVMEIPALMDSAEPLAAQLDHFLDLLDAGAGSPEVARARSAILPTHLVIARAETSAHASVGRDTVDRDTVDGDVHHVAG